MAEFDYGADPTGFQQSSQSTEKSIKSCYAVVYELDNRKWVVAGEGGWSEVHLCEDSLDNSHRILAWTVKSQQVLMNCNVTAECAYKEKSKNFHSFSDENGNRYGLGFHKSESGLKQATHFLKSVKSVIEQCKVDLNPSPPEEPLQEYQQPQHKQSSKTPQHPTPQNPPSSNQNTNDSYAQNNDYGNELESAQPGGGGAGGMPPPNPYQPSHDSNHNHNQYGNQQNDNQYGQQQNSYNQSQQNVSDVNNYSQKPQPPPMFSDVNNNGNGNGNGNGYNQNYGGSQQQQNKYGQQNQYNDYGSSQQQVQPSYNNQQNQNNNQGYNDNHNSYNNNKYQQAQSPGPMSPDTAALKNGVGSGGNNNFQPTYHLTKEQHKSIPTVPLGPLGNLKILPPKQQKHLSGDKKIKQPTAVEHKMRVTHNKETGRYEGLPKEWLEHLNKQFGVSPKDLPGIAFNQYQSKIPKVLCMLRNALEEANGYQQVGIFRLAPNASDNKAVKEKIDKGQLNENSEEKVDVNVYANLIKVWFRDLPDPLLNCVNPDLIEHVSSQSDAADVVNSFPEPNKSIFLWLCDMCVDIAIHEKTNKMSAQNMAIVVGPNLFNTDKFENPMKAMTYSGKVVEFFKHAILWRQSSM